MSLLRAEHTGEQIAFYRSGLIPSLLTQRAATDHRPYIHPILAPDGQGELTENEPGHHLWQHGLYVGLNDVNGVGFWTEGLTGRKDRDGTFHPQPLAPPVVLGSTASWEVVTAWCSPQGEPLLTETQKWLLHDRGDTLALDLAWELRAETDLRFGQHSYGGLFLRMPWRAATGCKILTSEGVTSHKEAEGQRARWVALAMPVPGRADGSFAGIAMLDHAANLEHPAPWRVDDNYGIAPSRCIAEEWHLAQNETATNHYRVFVYTGEISRDAVETEWQAFTNAAAAA